MKFRMINIILALTVMAGCGDTPLFTRLATNSIKVVIKGTYESNDPRDWAPEFTAYDDVADAIIRDDSVDDLNPDTYAPIDPNSDPDALFCKNNPTLCNSDLYNHYYSPPTKFMLDIAEMRISDGTQTQRFANYRKTYSPGLIDNSFFNGAGVVYENDDVRPDYTWRYLKVYVRKMLFDKSFIYSYDDDPDVINGAGAWAYHSTNTDIFAEEDTQGLNFNLLNKNSYYDSLLYQAGSINRIFPLVVKIEEPFIFDNDLPETVLEVRFVVKNFIKKYEMDYISNSVRYAKHFYAFSDWLRNVKPGVTSDKVNGGFISECETMGGNVIAIARSYIPGRTVTLTGDAGATQCYVIAINQHHSIAEYSISALDLERPACDEPKNPLIDLPLDLESVLDYHLEREKYFEEYNDFIDCVNAVTDPYEDQWNKYEDKVKSFKIPPLVTWIDTGTTFTLTNVPVGYKYKIYRSTCFGSSEDDACKANALPGEFEAELFQKDVSPEQAGETISLP